MKDDAPSISQWKDLYSAAVKFKKLKPWEWMYDSDIFGVQNPETGEIGYCCVMGRAGEHFALGVYLGREGLDNLSSMLSGEIVPDFPETLYSQKCLMASFENREDIEKPDYEIIRTLGLRFRGRNQWPLFRSYLPGYYPWYLTRKEIKFLTVALEQAIEVCKSFKENLAILNHPDKPKILVREAEKTNNGFKWEDRWLDPGKFDNEREIPVEYVEDDILDDLLKLKHDGVWEADYLTLLEVVQEWDERPYFPKYITWADRDTGLILNTGIAGPDEWISTFLETFQQINHQKESLPQKILVKKEEIYQVIKPITSQLGIELSLEDDLEVTEEIQDEFTNFDQDLMDDILGVLMKNDEFKNMLESDSYLDILDNESLSDLLKDESFKALLEEQLDASLEEKPPAVTDADIPVEILDENPRSAQNNKYTPTKQITLFNDKSVKKQEFLDKKRDVRDEFNDLLEKDYDNLRMKTELKKLTRKDPDYLNTYIQLYFILNEEGDLPEAIKMLDEAYKRALDLIIDDDGEWPKKLDSMRKENKHIVNSIYHKAISLWEADETEQALDLLRRLLNMDPDDDIGARIAILSIRMNMTHQEFDEKFLTDDGYFIDIVLNWFEENYRKFPDEFGWWDKIMKKNFRYVYQFRIDLADIRPPIWRRIQVPETYTFYDLHVAIQNAMDWCGGHLHGFYVTNPFTGRKDDLETPEEETSISDWLNPANPRANYVYDFGDYWDHKIQLEKILPREDDVNYPVCIKGKRASPPEDCGSVPGYYKLLKIIKDPDHEEYKEMIEWLGGEFDPEHFDPHEVVFEDPDEYRDDDIKLREELGLL